jgi:NADP-dependent aldehyde dehydrogenase
MKVTGHLIIGAADVGPSAGTMRALDPRTNTAIEPPFAFGAEAEVERAARLADAAFDSYNATTLAQRAAFLERIADNLAQAAPALAERASLETGLPAPQLEGETAKTAETLRKFAAVVRQGRFRAAAIDTAQPGRKPFPDIVFGGGRRYGLRPGGRQPSDRQGAQCASGRLRDRRTRDP